MAIEKPLFWDWATFSGYGILTGIKKDAPKEAVKSYEDYFEQMKLAEEQGIKL